MRNGDRQYKVEIKPGHNIGSYHLLDGVRVTIRYAGQQPTCGRCHRVATDCKGGGIAKRCEAQGGERVDFKVFIEKLWRDIGYCPDSDQEDFDEDIDNVELATQFTPPKVQAFPLENFTGVSIKRFPRDIDNGDILEFLLTNGLPEDKKKAVQINNNGSVIIRDLDNYIVEYLMQSIHGKMKFGRKLYCNGLVTLTPEKIEKANVPVIVPLVSDITSSLSLIGQEYSNDIDDCTDKSKMLNLDLQKSSSFIDEVKEQLSDFASCVESEVGSNDELDNGFKPVEEMKRQRKNKRKTRDSPNKDFFLKKPNLVQK